MNERERLLRLEVFAVLLCLLTMVVVYFAGRDISNLQRRVTAVEEGRR